jgi:peroxiredoxin
MPGLQLPNVPLPATTGETIRLAEVPGRAVLFVYPWTGRPGYPDPPGWDDIPGAHGSTPQAEGFAALYPQFRAASLAVFGLSGQPPDWQSEFATRKTLPYPLLSDAGFVFARALRLPSFEAGGETYLRRLTLIIAGGIIEAVIYPVHPPDTHASDVLERLSTEPGRVPLG